MIALVFAQPALAEGKSRATENKLRQMYRFYYLPFSIDFQEGRGVNDIIPIVLGKSGTPDRVLKSDELIQLDTQWEAMRLPLRKKSLLLNTPVEAGKTTRITNRLVSHVVNTTRGALDSLPLESRIKINDTLADKSNEVAADFRQLRSLKSFLGNADDAKFNFFLVSASWCESCKEYRMLFEHYLKSYPEADLVFHSIVVDDPKGQIFESRFLKELFPNPKRYTHESVPRFLALETVEGKPMVWEEGDALQELFERYYKAHRGYLDQKIPFLFKQPQLTEAVSVDPMKAGLAK